MKNTKKDAQEVLNDKNAKRRKDSNNKKDEIHMKYRKQKYEFNDKRKINIKTLETIYFNIKVISRHQSQRFLVIQLNMNYLQLQKLV